jgi:hypothetical protein
MAIILQFHNSNMNSDQYYEVLRRLETAGQGSPKGRLYHFCYEDSGQLNVTDVWDNMENFKAFGETLLPILKELSIDLNQPTPLPVVNVIKGA